MVIIELEMDQATFDALERAALDNRLSLRQECLRRLNGEGRRSRYINALIAELRADDEQRRAATSGKRAGRG